MDTEYVLNLSYGKDSLAAVHVWVDILKMPLHRIVHAEVWATDTIPADLPPMMEFKSKADRIIKDRWGIDVEHVVATSKNEILTYEKIFYRKFSRGENQSIIRISNAANPLVSINAQKSSTRRYTDSHLQEKEWDGVTNSRKEIYGFPISINRGNWCTKLKQVFR